MFRRLFALLITIQISTAALVGQTSNALPEREKVLIVPPGQSRTFMFTNKLGLFYYGETSQPNISAFHGLSYLTRKYLDDYFIEIAGEELRRDKAEVHLLGNKIIRYFSNPELEEEIAIVDSLPVMMIKIRSKQKAPTTIGARIAEGTLADYTIEWSAADKMLQISRKHQLVRNDDKNYPAWLGIYAYPDGEYIPAEIDTAPAKSQSSRNKSFCPGEINVYLESEVLILFIIGESKSDLLKIRNRMLKNLKIELKKPNSQIEGVRQA
ncbi:MAG: hypothetical protein ONB16_06470 [candidate division KSB1 bacterium]|nr:hypothetical protein [candidate division KSB1 bacterium]